MSIAETCLGCNVVEQSDTTTAINRYQHRKQFSHVCSDALYTVLNMTQQLMYDFLLHAGQVDITKTTVREKLLKSVIDS